MKVQTRRTALNNVAVVLKEMRHGCSLHLEYRRGNRLWWLSDGRAVLDQTARAVIDHQSVVGVGDGLFDFVQCQTWRFVEL